MKLCLPVRKLLLRRQYVCRSKSIDVDVRSAFVRPQEKAHRSTTTEGERRFKTILLGFVHNTRLDCEHRSQA